MSFFGNFGASPAPGKSAEKVSKICFYSDPSYGWTTPEKRPGERFCDGNLKGKPVQNGRFQTLKNAKGKGDATTSRAFPRSATDEAATFRKS